MQQTTMFDGVKRAQQLIDIRFTYGEKKREALFNSLSQHVGHDYLVEPKNILFESNGGRVDLMFRTPMGDSHWFDIHRHAMSQICSKAKFPSRYVDYLIGKKEAWAFKLVCENLNELYGNMKKTNLLVRTVNGTARGLLSDRYALHLSTDPLIHRFNDYAFAQSARPIGATWSDIRVNLEMALPYVYQPFVGQHLLIGMSFFNSDYGAGTYTLSPSIMDIDRNYSMAIPSEALDSIKKIHLGPILAREDLNRVSSDRGRRVDYNVRQMRTMMEAKLSKEYCEGVCLAVAKARDFTTTWGVIKSKLFAHLLKEELNELEKRLKDRDPKLPQLEEDDDGLPIPTNWWAASAVAHMASLEDDPDRKIDLQYQAGQFIKL